MSILKRSYRWPLLMLALMAMILSSLFAPAMSAEAAKAKAPAGGYHAYVPDSIGGKKCATRTGSGCEYAKPILAAIKAVPCPKKGKAPAVIRASVFNMNVRAYVTALKPKLACGVQLHYLTYKGSDDDGDRKDTTDETTLIKNLIKGHGGSWFKECDWSCYDTRKKVGSTHQKLWQFSETGGRKWLTLVGSANATLGADDRMFDDQTAVYDRCIYDGTARWIEAGRADKKPSKKIRRTISSCDKKRTLSVSPGGRNVSVDVLHAQKKGKGCRAELDMHILTLKAPVKEMVRLQKGNCRTRALVNWRLYKAVKSQNSAYLARIRELVVAGVDTRDTSWKSPTYVHRMTVITPKRMTMGSANQSRETFKSGNAQLTSKVPADIRAAWKASDTMAAKSKRLTKADVGCVGKKKRQPRGC